MIVQICGHDGRSSADGELWVVAAMDAPAE